MTKILLKDISMAADGSVWAIDKAESKIHRLIGDAGFIDFVPDRLGYGESVTATDMGGCFTVNKDGEIWQLRGGEMYLEGEWTKVETYSGQNDAKSVVYAGTPWYIQNDDVIMRPSSNVGASFWMPAGNGKGVSVAPLTDSRFEAFCVNQAGEIWKYDGRATWSKIGGYRGRDDAKMIAAGSDNSVGYVSKTGSVYRYTGSGWAPEASAGANLLQNIELISISNKENMWCLDAEGVAYHLWENKWSKFVGRQGYTEWHYTVKEGDHLRQIVINEFGLTTDAEIRQRGNNIASA
ncbi:MAG: tectonin domain-containing protein, partial [Chloroflexota bacterium]